MNKRITILIFLGFLYYPFFSLAQDSIPTAKDISEEKELKFQQYFFKALSEKSIMNYENAIRNLENCHELLPNTVSVLFELSKNYLFLNRTTEAKIYIKKALAKKPDDIWMLSHLVAIYKKEYDYKNAIITQKQIIKTDPSKREGMVFLYVQNKEYKKAIELMDILEYEEGLSENLKKLKTNLHRGKSKPVEKKEPADLKALIKNFENNPSSFKVLKMILQKAALEDQTILNIYSKEAVELFPAQPFVYLMRGRFLNYQKSYKKALVILQSGIDFVIDNKSMEAGFYDEISKAYLGLNNIAKADEYRNKAKRLRAVK
ncbi:MAG: hypothetical protein GKR88_00640 [Flavobacteriaceae bacterium]|nr:MAG: hypothetical protein GKR88_00640 [Flavobacteriaceae bacterium]